MNVVMEQHQSWKQARARLEGAKPLLKPQPVVKTVEVRQPEESKRKKRKSMLELRLRRMLKAPLFNRTVTEICARRGVSPLLVAGDNRQREIIAARNEIFAALAALGYSRTAIGRAFGKDHTTVMHGIRRHLGEPVKEARRLAIERGEPLPPQANTHPKPPFLVLKEAGL